MLHRQRGQRRPWLGLLTLGLLGLALVAAFLIHPLLQGHAAPQATAHPTPLLYGTNMALYDGQDQLTQSAPTQQLLRQKGMAIIRMPFRLNLTDAVDLAALQAIKNVGAAPLVIVQGAVDPNVVKDDVHQIQLAQQVFGATQVYVEFGNEEDLAGVDVTRYTAAWNATVAQLKAMAPTYKFIGPVNFQYNPSYIATFDQHASPRPDFNSWHEYVCNTGESDSYCLSHIANWSTHVTLTNQAVQAAIGATIPIMITEWNLDPQQDPRYSNSAFMSQWTQQALSTLAATTAYGVVAAMQYCATNNQGFNLIDSSNQPTTEGQTLFSALGLVRSGGASVTTMPATTPASTSGAASTPSSNSTPNTSSSASGTSTPADSASAATPTSPSIPSSVSLAPTGSSLFAFGNGSTSGWQSYGSQIAALRAVSARAANPAGLELQLNQLTAQTYPYVAVRGHLVVPAGTTITFNVFMPQNVDAVLARPYVMGADYQWVGPNRYQQLHTGWNQVTLEIPDSASNDAMQLGIQVMANPGDTVSGSIYLNSVTASK